MKQKFKCSMCRTEKPLGHSGGTGYAHYGKSNRNVCYTCCAEMDKRYMAKHGRIALYLTSKPSLRPSDPVPLPPVWEVTNWPGTLRFSARVRTGSHNMAGKRYDAWFTGPDGKRWHGVTYGDNTQVCHCHRSETRQ